MRQFDHPNIIAIDSVYETKNSFYIVLELLQGGNLKHLIKEKGALSIQTCTIIMKTMLKVLNHLHESKILHRDIKPENILFRVNAEKIKEEDVVLADFGFAVCSNILPFHHPRCGTPGYVAPEILKLRNKSQGYSQACDIFSLGITFYHMLCGRLPYDVKNHEELMRKNGDCIFDFALNKKFNSSSCSAGMFISV
jgi:serine/threonine protein kinase